MCLSANTLFKYIQLFIQMTTVISHIYNESYLLPYWLEYHKNIFDHGIIIDYESTDNSLDIVKQICPSWTIIQSRNKYFEAIEVDNEVMDIENTVTGYKMALNTTEWLFITDKLENILKHNCYAIYPMVLARGDINEVNNTYEFIRNFTKVVKHHPDRGGYRIIHNYNNGQYKPGRHDTSHAITVPENMFVIWAGLYPNNKQTLERKLAIKTKMPQSDINRGFGHTHLFTESRIQEDMNNIIGTDILNDDMYKLAYNYAMKLIGYS